MKWSVWQVELEEVNDAKGQGNKKGEKTVVKKRKLAVEALPSPSAERIVPKIDEGVRKKAAAAKIAATRGPKKKQPAADGDEFDNIVSKATKKGLASRVGNSPTMIEKYFVKKEKKPKVIINAFSSLFIYGFCYSLCFVIMVYDFCVIFFLELLVFFFLASIMQ